MPGGICASKANFRGQVPDATGRYDVKCCGNRVAMVDLKSGPFTFRLKMAGRYDSDLTESSGARVADLSALRADRPVTIDWTDATFIGRHWLLGPFRVELVPEKPAKGRVEAENKASGQFFPALNENAFFFRVHLERFGKILENRTALINRATVKTIPPVGSLYELAEPVPFFDKDSGRSWSNITKCWVLIPDQRYVEIDVTRIDEHANRFDVEATLTNVSPRRFVLAYWFTNVEDPENERYAPAMGLKWLGRTPRKIRFSMHFKDFPKEPTIQIGAAVITNPIANNPNENAGNGIAAFDVPARAAYLKTL